MKNLKLMLAATAMTTAVFASNLSRNAAPTEPKRNNFLDYSTKSTDSEISFTLGLDMRATQPELSVNVGRLNYEATEDDKFIPGENIHFYSDYIPAIGGKAIFSDRSTGVIIAFNVDHYKLAANTMHVAAGEESYITLNQSLRGLSDVSYDRIQHSFSNEMTTFSLALGGYSLQYKNFAMNSLFGAAASHMQMERAIRGTDRADESIVNTFTNNQNSIVAGITTKITPSLIIYDSEFSSMYLTAELGLTGSIAQNTGNCVSYQTNMETEDLGFTSNTLIDNWNYVSSCTKKLALALVSKPQDKDTSFFTMHLGVGSDTAADLDQITEVITGRGGDLTSTYAFLSIAYSM